MRIARRVGSGAPACTPSQRLANRSKCRHDAKVTTDDFRRWIENFRAATAREEEEWRNRPLPPETALQHALAEQAVGADVPGGGNHEEDGRGDFHRDDRAPARSKGDLESSRQSARPR